MQTPTPRSSAPTSLTSLTNLAHFDLAAVALRAQDLAAHQAHGGVLAVLPLRVGARELRHHVHQLREIFRQGDKLRRFTGFCENEKS